MAKFHKVYPNPYNGISQQIPELILDSQCKDMVNCIPDLISGTSKRPPAEYITHHIDHDPDAKVVHTYDRGEDEEEYIFVATNEPTNPLAIFLKDGTTKVLDYGVDTVEIKAYLTTSINVLNLRGMTVQDRTFMFNKEKTVAIETASPITIIPTAFYWIKKSSSDINNEFRYAVYLDGTNLFETVDDQSDIATDELQTLINAHADYTCTNVGNVLKIQKTDESDFTFSSWDSWGSQASFGWKESVSKLSDLPQELGWNDEYVKIDGDDKNKFTDYWVKSNNTSWLETKDPSDTRGILTNMPIAIDRQADGSFLCNLLPWDLPKVGDTKTNPTPSFVGQKINDLFFYKNRLGIASRESAIMSEIGGYYNYYIKTVLDILDADPIDIALASTTASEIQYVKPFQGSLFLFTKEGQFEMISQGITSPLSVSIESVSSFPMAISVEPKVSGNSLFFISITNNKQQLREYRKNQNTLTVTGIDLNITTPNLLDSSIQNILINGVLGFVFVTTNSNEVFLYNYKENGAERVQSAWSRWKFFENFVVDSGSYEYNILNNLLIIIYKEDGKYIYNSLDLTKYNQTNFADIVLSEAEQILNDCDETFSCDAVFCTGVNIPYECYIELPKWYPRSVSGEISSPKDKILLKKVTIEGSGNFDAEVYRNDYDTTYTKTHDNTDMQDLDLHISSRVDKVDIKIIDNTTDDFTLTSFIVEGLYSPTSKELR